jgi:predicted Zn-dependent peptidase
LENVERIEYKNINEVLYKYEHKSGLKVFFVPKKGYVKKYATFATHFGSINNNFRDNGSEKSIKIPDGIAHFLEHKLFEQEDGDMMNKFSELGADSNAYTSFNQTVYLFSCINKFYDNLKLLLNFVQNPYLTEKSVEKEKGIIAQEINMYNDNPHWRVFFNLLDGLYVNHPVKIDITGSIESINKIDKDILYKCYETFYNLKNMVVLVVGDLDIEKIIEVVDENVKNLNKDFNVENIFPKEPDNINKSYIETFLDVADPIFQIGFKDTKMPRAGEESVIYELAVMIIQDIIFGKSSDFFINSYESGIINNSFQYDFTVEIEYAYSTLSGESKDPLKVKEAVLKTVEDIKVNNISEEDFKRTKKAYYGKFIKYLNSVEKISNLFNSVYFRDINIFDYYKLYDKITYNLIVKVLNAHFDSNKMVLSVVKANKEVS